MRRPSTCVLLVLVLSSTASSADDYTLDAHSRTTSARGAVQCPKVKLVRYKGDIVRFHKPVLVHVDFVERLRRFEAIVRDVALEVYGRAPSRIRHLGTYNCRRIRAYPEWLSEHAFGNAIDVAGFRFGPAPREAKGELPRALRRRFEVRVLDHWGKEGGVAGRYHARFLDRLARRLTERDDIFRVLLGPGYPGHADHFHFDCGPYRMIEIW